MRKDGNITIDLEAAPDMERRKGLTSHPYRVLELVRRKRTQSSVRNGKSNRTIVKFKRGQGTHTGRKEAVARILKQNSLDTYKHVSGDSVFELESETNDRTLSGESGFDLPGSMSMACWERYDRNLGKTRSFPEETSNQIHRVRESTNRSEPIQLRVADRLVRGRASHLQPAGRPELITKEGRQNNVARKGNMDLKE